MTPDQRARKLYKTPEYIIWQNIKARCFNSSSPHYHNYGGRGITMYQPWIAKPLLFYIYLNSTIGLKPQDKSLDRIDNSGNYEPGNLRWANRQVQTVNQRIQPSNKSGYRGVFWNKWLATQKWAAKICVNQKNIFLGNYNTKEEAAAAYDRAAIKYFGDFAILNLGAKEEETK